MSSSRTFRRESNCKRHKCVAERRKPVSELRVSVQSQMCRMWFRSKGGLAVHVCRPGDSQTECGRQCLS